MNFITLTTCEGPRLRVKESLVSSWIESSNQFPGLTTVVYVEAQKPVIVHVKECMEVVDRKMVDAAAFDMPILREGVL